MESIVLSAQPSLERIVQAQLAAWPEHDDFLRKRFAATELGFAERVASLALRLAGDDLPRICADYKWMCERILEEELYFRRTGRYRLSTLAEARREVYDDHAYMTQYMHGVLLSHIFWANHTAVMEYYVDTFLASNPPGYRHLEIGPGHGLLLYFAAEDARSGAVAAWDLSAASLDATGHAMQALGVRRAPRLVRRDFADAVDDGERFDSIVISEVCEHLEDPRAALQSLRRSLAPGGRLFVNVPVNSPAPDHLYLLRTPEEAVDLVASSGYAIAETRFFPITGYSLERARKTDSTISCVVVAGHPA